MNDLQITSTERYVPRRAARTVATLLAAMGVDPARVAVEKNHDVVPRRTWAEAPVADGDRIEIVAFIGGGSDGRPRKPPATRWSSRARRFTRGS